MNQPKGFQKTPDLPPMPTCYLSISAIEHFDRVPFATNDHEASPCATIPTDRHHSPSCELQIRLPYTYNPIVEMESDSRTVGYMARSIRAMRAN